MKTKKTTKQRAKDEADKWTSLYVRLNGSDWRGYCQCYTCDKVAHYKQMQCGHFISRSSSTLRYDERNLRIQCVGCNVYKSGNYIEYTMRLIKEKGKRHVEKLQSDGKIPHQFTEDELKEIAAKYKNKVLKMNNYDR